MPKEGRGKMHRDTDKTPYSDVRVRRVMLAHSDDGGVEIRSRSGRKPRPVTKMVPYPNTDRLVRGRPAVGHTEYARDGTARFSFKDGARVDRSNRRGRVTGHTREYEMTTGRKLRSGRKKVITGHSYDGENMRFGSSTHNTGEGSHLDPDRYTEDGSRQAGPAEQQVHRDMLEAWDRDGQPQTGWAYNPRSGRAEGPNAGWSGFDDDDYDDY